MPVSVTSLTEISSNALLMLGDKAITDLAEDTDRAILANSLINPTRDETLRAHPWNFAMARAALAADVTAPVWEWSYAYTLPTDPYCLRVWRAEADEDQDVWRVEGRKIVTNRGAPFRILYIARVTDVSLYDALFISALTARMAAKMALPVTGSGEKAKDMWAIYAGILREARSIDGQEGIPEILDTPTLTEVR